MMSLFDEIALCMKTVAYLPVTFAIGIAPLGIRSYYHDMCTWKACTNLVKYPRPQRCDTPTAVEKKLCTISGSVNGSGYYAIFT